MSYSLNIKKVRDFLALKKTITEIFPKPPEGWLEPFRKFVYQKLNSN